MGGVDDELFSKLEKTKELASDQNLALPVLARHVHANLTCLPTAVVSNAKGAGKDKFLFRVESQTNALRKLNRLFAQRIWGFRHPLDARANDSYQARDCLRGLEVERLQTRCEGPR